MTNEQYSNMMVSLEKLEAKIEKLEEMLKGFAVTSVSVDKKDILPEDLSNFWNEGKAPTFNRFGTFDLGATME